MKSYIIQIEENQKADKENLMLIIKSLASVGIRTKSAGIQQMKTINMKENSDNENRA